MGVWLVDLRGNVLTKNCDQFNSLVIIVEILIVLLVFGLLILVNSNYNWRLRFTHWVSLELLWTITPIIILVVLAFPSLKNLYSSELFLGKNNLNLKIIGHQWYWEYSMPELNITLDCYPNNKRTLYRIGESELLILPFKCSIRSLITSQDVIHSWCLPSIGFKLDACPGRLNYFMINSNCLSFIVGQCSELCGAYHSWIPIQVEFTSSLLFSEYLKLLI